MRVLVMAKAPVPGRAKTRLGAVVGHEQAAGVAAAALLDTLDAAAACVGAADCVLALDGDLDDAAHGPEIAASLHGWTVLPQRGDGFAARLAHAHLDAGPGPLAQVGMDTPQLTPDLLADALGALTGHDAVLGPADDGGWWVLARHDERAGRSLVDVEMSTSTTYDDSRAALEAAGLRVATTAGLRDVDTVEDADAVALLAPRTRFARAWSQVAHGAVGR